MDLWVHLARQPAGLGDAVSETSYVSSPTYKLLRGRYPTLPAQNNPTGLRMSDDGGWSESAVLQTERSHLNAVSLPAGSVGVFMWSWCGEMSWLSVASVQNYLAMLGAVREFNGR